MRIEPQLLLTLFFALSVTLILAEAVKAWAEVKRRLEQKRKLEEIRSLRKKTVDQIISEINTEVSNVSISERGLSLFFYLRFKTLLISLLMSKARAIKFLMELRDLKKKVLENQG